MLLPHHGTCVAAKKGLVCDRGSVYSLFLGHTLDYVHDCGVGSLVRMVIGVGIRFSITLRSRLDP